MNKRLALFTGERILTAIDHNVPWCAMSEQKRCFVVSPIGVDGSAERRNADKVLRHIITPVVKPLGYIVERADQVETPGIITTQIVSMTIEYELVIADLTDMNANVFYELAIRHCVGKPVIQIMRAGDKIPFDVAASRTIFYNVSDPDDLISAKDSLLAQIKEITKDEYKVENPVTNSMKFLRLTKSAEPQDRNIGDLLAAITEIRADIAKTPAVEGAKSMGLLADGVQSLIQHMRAEQQQIRDWVEAQAEQNGEIKSLLRRLAQ